MATPTNLPASFTSEVLTSAAMNNLRGAFRILQVVTGTTSTATDSSSATLADTGLTATITPQSSSSKILIYATHPQCFKSSGNSFNCLKMSLLRGATEIQTIATVLGFNGQLQESYFATSTAYLDSPATTSATTYKTQFASRFGAATVRVQADGSASTIVLMEVSA